MPEPIKRGNWNFRRTFREMSKGEKTTASLGDIVTRIQQPYPEKPYGLKDKLDDAMFERGFGQGSTHTQIDKDRANARAELVQYISNQENVQNFQRLSPEMREGIFSLIRGY